MEKVARQYGVTYLQLGGPVDGIDVRQCPDDPASPQSSFQPARGPCSAASMLVERPGLSLSTGKVGLLLQVVAT